MNNIRNSFSMFPQKTCFSMASIKKKMLYCFIAITETMPLATSPVSLILAKLSFVKITPLWRYQRKIFILRESFNFQMNLLVKRVSGLSSTYILTVQRIDHDYVDPS